MYIYIRWIGLELMLPAKSASLKYGRYKMKDGPQPGNKKVHIDNNPLKATKVLSVMLIFI